MKIHGLQKMTLLDFPGKVACTVFTAGCDFRCPFCHNSELLDMNAADPLMDSEQLLEFLKGRKGLLEGVAFTGGEPLMQPELPELMCKIKALGYPIKLDTNGNRPALLRSLVAEGLVDYVAMDIKNSPARYGVTVGRNDFDLTNIRESIAFLLGGAVDYEFRTTVVAELHNDESFLAIRDMIRGAKRYFLQAFTDRDSVLMSGLSTPAAADLARYAELVRPYVGEVFVRGVNELK